MLATARTFALIGVDAIPVDVEVDIHRGLPAFSVVGLPDAAVREARERVRAAIVNSGFEFPLKRITASLAPADLRKAGPGFDLAIAAAILVASGQISPSLLERWALAGELALDGRIRPVRGALAMAQATGAGSRGGIVLPAENGEEGTLVPDVRIAPIPKLGALGPLAEGELPDPPEVSGSVSEDPAHLPDMADLRGQPALRRALEIAAAGCHSLLIVGPPGAGKSLAARRLPSILPPLGPDELVEVARIAGAAGVRRARSGEAALRRPFRAPHHTISPAGLVGGGTPPRPGEITLANRGVLFLDEVAEFTRMSLEAMRQPLESGEVTIARAKGALRFPARFQLIAAANPCPCGHGEGSPRCSCSPEAARRYAARLSGALSDRIDLTIGVQQPGAGELAAGASEDSTTIRERVIEARSRQAQRFGNGSTNAEVDDAVLRAEARLVGSGQQALEEGQLRLGLSGRGWTRALRVARTCADLAGSEDVNGDHVAEALAMRSRLGEI